MYRSLSTAIGILLALTLTTAPALGHQSSTASISLPNVTSANEPISANELDAAAQLYTRIEIIYATYETKLIGADTETEKTAIEDKREGAIEETIQNAALTAERYRVILDRASQNEDLQSRLQDRIRRARTQNGATAGNEAPAEPEGVSTLGTDSSQKQTCSAGPSDSTAE